MEKIPHWYDKGLRGSVRRWRKFLTNPEVIVLKLHEPLQLRPYLKELIMDKKEVNIADVGCGPFSWVGNLCDGVKINLFPSDIWADSYRGLLRELGIVPTNPAERQDMEALTYPDNFFDIVYCANAVDKTVNPKKAIQEMIRVCKPGGYVYLRHARDSGRRQHYHFLYYWNITLDWDNEVKQHPDDHEDCLFWDRDNANNFYISDIAPGFINEFKRDWEGWDMPRPGIISILRKP